MRDRACASAWGYAWEAMRVACRSPHFQLAVGVCSYCVTYCRNYNAPLHYGPMTSLIFSWIASAHKVFHNVQEHWHHFTCEWYFESFARRTHEKTFPAANHKSLQQSRIMRRLCGRWANEIVLFFRARFLTYTSGTRAPQLSKITMGQRWEVYRWYAWTTCDSAWLLIKTRGTLFPWHVGRITPEQFIGADLRRWT